MPVASSGDSLRPDRMIVSANAPSSDSQWVRTVSHHDASSTRAGLRGIARALRRCGIPGPRRNTVPPTACTTGTHSPRMSAGTTKDRPNPTCRMAGICRARISRSRSPRSKTGRCRRADRRSAAATGRNTTGSPTRHPGRSPARRRAARGPGSTDTTPSPRRWSRSASGSRASTGSGRRHDRRAGQIRPAVAVATVIPPGAFHPGLGHQAAPSGAVDRAPHGISCSRSTTAVRAGFIGSPDRCPVARLW